MKIMGYFSIKPSLIDDWLMLAIISLKDTNGVNTLLCQQIETYNFVMSGILRNDLIRAQFIDWFNIELDDWRTLRSIEFVGKWTDQEISWLKQSLVTALNDLRVENDIIRTYSSFKWTLHKHSSLQPIDFILNVQEEKLLNGKVISKVYGIRLPDIHLESKIPLQILNENKLSKREMEVVDFIVLGFTNKEIAKALFISAYTVDGHRSKIYKKLGIHSFKELILRMRKISEQS